MSQPIYFSGSILPASGSTSYGFYDNDSHFQQEAPKFANWAARRLGYPVVQVELADFHFYDALEEAISEYGAQVNQINIKNNLYDLLGGSNAGDLNNTLINGSGLNGLINIAKDYGAEIGVGGNITWHTGSIELQANRQIYDLNEFAATHANGKKIEIKRIWHKRSPAITRYFDPYAITGVGTINIMQEFGFTGFTPGTQFLMMPLYEDLLRLQAIELNDHIRRSSYSFELINNQLRIFPVPKNAQNMWFNYILTEDRTNYGTGSVDPIITDYSNIPYRNLTYTNINDVGRQWIRRYALAVVREELGIIRAKFQGIPVADGEINMDGDTLRTEAVADKENLITELRETLEETSKKAQIQAKREISEAVQEQLSRVPTFIYVR